MTFHVNPKTGRVGQCKNEQACALGPDAHGATREEAKRAHEVLMACLPAAGNIHFAPSPAAVTLRHEHTIEAIAPMFEGTVEEKQARAVHLVSRIERGAHKPTGRLAAVVAPGSPESFSGGSSDQTLAAAAAAKLNVALF